MTRRYKSPSSPARLPPPRVDAPTARPARPPCAVGNMEFDLNPKNGQLHSLWNANYPAEFDKEVPMDESADGQRHLIFKCMVCTGMYSEGTGGKTGPCNQWKLDIIAKDNWDLRNPSRALKQAILNAINDHAKEPDAMHQQHLRWDKEQANKLAAAASSDKPAAAASTEAGAPRDTDPSPAPAPARASRPTPRPPSSCAADAAPSSRVLGETSAAAAASTDAGAPRARHTDPAPAPAPARASRHAPAHLPRPQPTRRRPSACWASRSARCSRRPPSRTARPASTRSWRTSPASTSARTS